MLEAEIWTLRQQINVLRRTAPKKLLLMSGLQIFNAHPALYWGEVSNFGDPALSITAQRTEGGASRGITFLADHTGEKAAHRMLLLALAIVNRRLQRHGLRISIRGHYGKWPISTIKFAEGY